jgi:Cu+-exporting ATPase
MTCANCAMNVERALGKKVPGWSMPVVNIAAERATVDYLPSMVTPDDLVQRWKSRIRRPDPDRKANRKTRKPRPGSGNCRPDPQVHGRRRLCPAAVCNQHGQGFWPHRTVEPPALGQLAVSRLATPVQFYTGWDYYVSGLKSLRNKSANMDVLVAMGSSTAYAYSLAVLLLSATWAGMSISRRRRSSSP